MSDSYTLYNETVMDHFMNPRNMGDIKDADAIGEVGAAACGDIMKITLKIDDDTQTVTDARFKTFGCGSAIAASSMATELIKGRTIEELQKSKARLVEEITIQLKANYEKQIFNLNDKIKATEQLFEKFKEENTSIHGKELEMLRKQNESIKLQYQNEISSIKRLGEEKERFAKQQIESLKNQAAPGGFNFGWLVVALAVIILFLLMRGCN